MANRLKLRNHKVAIDCCARCRGTRGTVQGKFFICANPDCRVPKVFQEREGA